MPKVIYGGFVALCVGLGSACTDDGLEHAEVDQAVEIANGVSLNGVSLNGVSLNGVSLNGVSLNGVSLNGVSLNGVSLNGVSLNGVALDGTAYSGVPAIGPTYTATLSNGSTLVLRIDSAVQGTGANADVWMYAVAFETDGGWQPLCGLDEAGAPTLALAVEGTWNTAAGVPGGGAYSNDGGQMTFACRGKSIAKCVELGYKTWTGHTHELESCVRLLRADYCGDGTSYTVNGQLVNLYDDAGIQVDTESWGVEAEWTRDGARCIRDATYTRAYRLGFAPTCAAQKVSATCGTFAAGAVLVDELP